MGMRQWNKHVRKTQRNGGEFSRLMTSHFLSNRCICQRTRELICFHIDWTTWLKRVHPKMFIPLSLPIHSVRPPPNCSSNEQIHNSTIKPIGNEMKMIWWMDIRHGLAMCVHSSYLFCSMYSVLCRKWKRCVLWWSNNIDWSRCFDFTIAGTGPISPLICY